MHTDSTHFLPVAIKAAASLTEHVDSQRVCELKDFKLTPVHVQVVSYGMHNHILAVALWYAILLKLGRPERMRAVKLVSRGQLDNLLNKLVFKPFKARRDKTEKYF